jgi:hypothetical protein
MSASITAQEYVVWVKGSLNRWLGAALSENGDTAPPYRGWVKEFQSLCDVCTRNGDVDEVTQNALIKANHQHDWYMNWVLQSLNQGMQGSALAADGSITPSTIAAIKNFQTANDLQPNGWVGAKTETALRKKGKRKPPSMAPKSVPLLIFHPRWGGRTARQLALFWSNQFRLEPLSTPPGSWIGLSILAHQTYVRKLLAALWQFDSDNDYVPGRRVADFVNAGKSAPAYGGIDNDQLPREFNTRYIKNALEDLIQETKFIMDVEVWSYANGYQQFKQAAMKLYKSIYDSLVNICFEVKTSDRSNFAVAYMGDWLLTKQKAGNSILRVFPSTFM